MIAEFETRVIKEFKCPSCGSLEHSCSHLEIGITFGPWYCDNCGIAIKGTVTDCGADIELLEKDRKYKTLVLLKLSELTETPVHIVVEGMVFIEKGRPVEVDQENDEYFYNEHTCPWNYLRVNVIHGEDSDPHGIFEHQETVLMPDNFEEDNVSDWSDIFKTLRVV